MWDFVHFSQLWDFVYAMGCPVRLYSGFVPSMCSNNDVSGIHDCEQISILTAPHISNYILNVTTFNNKCQILLINQCHFICVQ